MSPAEFEYCRSQVRLAGLALAMKTKTIKAERRYLYCTLSGWRGEIARAILKLSQTPSPTERGEF